LVKTLLSVSSVARLRGLRPISLSVPGVPLRSTPGFMLSPAPRVFLQGLSEEKIL
jgi:hypothetical protein